MVGKRVVKVPIERLGFAPLHLPSGRAWSALSLACSCLLVSACGASAHGSAEHAEGDHAHEEPASRDDGSDTEGRAADATKTASGEPSDAPPPEPTPEERREARLEALELSRARAALAAVSSPDNDLGLVFTIAARTSDVPWLFVLENRGEEPVTVLARPDLVAFEVAPPREPEPAEGTPATSATSTTAKSKTAGTKPPPPPPWCGSVEPKAGDSTLAESELVLAPGEMITYPFDPRPLCADPALLAPGSTITPRFGFAPKLKKIWRKGKQEEVEENAGAPFVARSMLAPVTSAPPVASAKTPPAPSTTSGEAPAPVLELKRLIGPTFVLGSTYPLEKVDALLPTSQSSAALGSEPTAPETPDGTSEPESQDDARAGRGAKPAGEREEPPPPVLEITVRPLGTTSDPDASTMTVVVKNVSGKGRYLFVRRELFVFGITGPRGATFCQMQPSGRAPDKSQFTYLAPGSSTSLTTRLPEACPPGTFTAPGTYAVHAQLVANQPGSEHGLEAFVGHVTSQQPGRFVVKGTAKDAQSVMRVSRR